ncbi:MAG: biotin/lipoyl-binding protein [Clostridiales bacterium]|nr:biotin/lipoyl-binding protein [Clostridiales bacterium]
MKKLNITVNGTTYEVIVEEVGEGSAPAAAPAASAAKTAPAAPAPKAQAPKAQGAAGSVQVKCPMPGTIVKLNFNVGDTVKKGEVLCLFEAMKMENEVMAPQDGTVASVNVTKGQSVQSGDLLYTLN